MNEYEGKIEQVQRQYRTSSDNVRSSFSRDPEAALEHYRNLVDFLIGVAPPDSKSARLKVLDAGCGTGWSTYALSEKGYDALGVDLNVDSFEPKTSDRLRFAAGSVLGVPFRNDRFDLVFSYQCIEHVPNPEKALQEMIRVCKPGGVVSVIGPNLVTPFVPLMYIAKPSAWKSIPLRRVDSTPKHPYGNTWLENIGSIFYKSYQLSQKLLTPGPTFTMRIPDDRPPFHADNDACYLCNPVDLVRYFKRLGFEILRSGRPGRPPLSRFLAGGTWVAVRKPMDAPEHKGI